MSKKDVLEIGVSEFVTKVANPYFTLREDFSDVSITKDFLSSSIKFAVKNKVFPLFYEGCLKLGIRLPKEADLLMDEYERKWRMQIEEMGSLLDISEKLGIEIMIFKTFKPFRYIPDDVDILLRHEKDLYPLITKLGEKGYFILKIGTPEVVLRKIGKGGAYVDLDIHTRLAIGYLDVFRVEDLWRIQAYERFKLENKWIAFKLSEDYEVVREAAYALLKDFNLSIPGLYFAIHALMKRDIRKIEKIAVRSNFYLPLVIYLYSAQYLAHKLFNFDIDLQLQFNKRFISTMPLRIIKSEISREFRVPYPYPVSVIAWTYMLKTWLEISRNRNLKVLGQVIKQPSSKGIGILLNYLRERFK
ncbi:hypothetical protein IMZ38_01130 [Thermosphaera chiliense]|uniref:Nucleotidyltransferase family protein n=1 Tax=Thermosphaera chiliense TaxID=3402707 RepID=A0A7M1UTN6_9CREN|nr:hypothetical protein [Thermosphaera aggregans]QOR94572.1 hypothetical protein IMZ38_01130 [Thermosphaera aggregans]